jgi:hypothetical protein
MQKKEIVPTAVLISHRYCGFCVAEILVPWRSIDIPYSRNALHNVIGLMKKNIQWSHPCFKEAIKKV